RAIFTDADPDVGSGQFYIGSGDACDADLVKGAREKGRKGGSKGNLAAYSKAGGNADHILFGDITLGKAVRIFFEELVRIRRVLGIAVERNDTSICAADAKQGISERFASCDHIADLVRDWRISRGRLVLRRRELVGRGNGMTNTRFG